LIKNIINNKNSKNHTIEPYRFKVIGSSFENEKKTPDETPDEPDKSEKPVNPKPIVQADEQQNRFIEELLKKSDELSSNIIKLQMQIEKQEGDFNSRLENELQRESQSAYKNGYQKAKDDLEKGVQEVKEKFLNSINTLEIEAKKGDEFLKQAESELSDTAIEIAREVISKEIKDSSSLVATTLSKKLIEELKDAKNIRLKVNPKDYESLNQTYSTVEHIGVDSDSAITQGGVVVLSDVGNLDANISTRLEKVKNIVKSD